MEQSLGPTTLLAQISTLRFPPAPLHAAQYREVFNRLSAMENFNFALTGEGVEMITPPGESGETMRVGLGRDAVSVSFDPTSRSADYAVEQLTAILKEISSVLPIPVFIQQTHIIRKTIPLSGEGDSRRFLTEQLLCVTEEGISGWKRPLGAVGVRFVFTPQQTQDVSNLNNFDLKIESYLQDPRKIFIENAATFLVPLPAGQWDQLKASLSEAHKFLDDYAVSILKGASNQ
jgi:hypothetical protein